MDNVFEWTGSILGLLGALLLATNTGVSRYGWFSFLAANVAMIIFAIDIDATGLLVQQLGFMCTSALGVYRSNGFRAGNASSEHQHVQRSTNIESA